MNLLVLIIILIFIFHQILYWTYYWQIKEYRLDRFRSDLKKHILLDQFNLSKWFRPKPTLRAISIIFVSLILVYFLSWWTVVVAPIIVTISVVVTALPFIVWKRFLINRAKMRMNCFKGTVIGITGSYGKSSTKQVLKWVLSSKFKVFSTLKNNNSEIGVAMTVLKGSLNVDYLIIEMGAYKRGEIKAICDIVHPKIGVITGIGDQHLELFGSLENIKKAKFELIDSLPKDGFRLVANEDFSLNEASNIKSFKDRVEFVFQDREFVVPVLGRELIRNLVAVIKVAKYCGLNLGEIAKSLKEFPGEDVYPKLLPGNIIDNSYNNSLEGFLSALDYLKVWKDYRKVVVTPGIVELGENTKIDHEKIENEMDFVDIVLTTKPGIFQKGEAITNVKKLKEKLVSLKDSNTVFLFQGRVPEYVKSF